MKSDVHGVISFAM